MENLPRHLRLGLQWGALLIVVFVGLIGYGLRAAPRMARDSQSALDTFYARCQRHDYARAYQLLSPELRDSLTLSDMKARFAQFEKTNGRIKSWAPSLGGGITFGGRINFVPPFVDYTHRVSGEIPSTMGTATVVYIRMVPRDGKWQLQKLSFMR